MSLRKIVSTLPPPPTRLTEPPVDGLNRGGGGRDPRASTQMRPQQSIKNRQHSNQLQ